MNKRKLLTLMGAPWKPSLLKLSQWIQSDNTINSGGTPTANGEKIVSAIDRVGLVNAVQATAKGTKYIDVYQWMLDNGGDDLVSVDGVHPNDAGHAQIAAAFLSVL